MTKNRQTFRSRRLLQEAFTILLKKKPFKKITISDITEEADLARSTFYAHFDTKEQLLISYVDDLLDQFFAMIATRDQGISDVERDIEININFFRIWDECCNIDEVVKAVDIDNLILGRFRQYWEKNSQETSPELRPDISPAFSNYLQNFLAYSFFGILKTWLTDDKKYPPEVMGQLLYDLTGPPVLRAVIEKYGSQIR
jgi:AcrR family transcriptional regulator